MNKLPVKVLGGALLVYWDEMFGLMLCNFMWLVAQILIVPGPPATAALFYVTNRVARGHVAKASEFWDAFRRYFGVGWKWGGLNIFIILILGNAVYFYGSIGVPGPFGFALSLASGFLLAAWLFTQLFAFPLWLEQTDKRIRVALRNALIFQAQNGWLMLMLLSLVVVVLALSYFFKPLVGLGSVSFLMVMGNAVVVAQVEALRGDAAGPVGARGRSDIDRGSYR